MASSSKLKAWRAVERNDYSQLRAMLVAGADVHTRGKASRTLLHQAAEDGNVDLVRLLLAAGAHHTEVDTDQKTPLHLCAEVGTWKVAQILVQHGADVDAENRYSETPLDSSRVSGQNLDKAAIALTLKQNLFLCDAEELRDAAATHRRAERKRIWAPTGMDYGSCSSSSAGEEEEEESTESIGGKLPQDVEESRIVAVAAADETAGTTEAEVADAEAKAEAKAGRASTSKSGATAGVATDIASTISGASDDAGENADVGGAETKTAESSGDESGDERWDGDRPLRLRFRCEPSWHWKWDDSTMPLVVHPGSTTTRFGFAVQPRPVHCVSSIVTVPTPKKGWPRPWRWRRCTANREDDEGGDGDWGRGAAATAVPASSIKPAVATPSTLRQKKKSRRKLLGRAKAGGGRPVLSKQLRRRPRAPGRYGDAAMFWWLKHQRAMQARAAVGNHLAPAGSGALDPNAGALWPMEYGQVKDWESMERLFTYVLEDHLRLDMDAAGLGNNPVLVADPPTSCAKSRERVAEVFIESFNAPALSLTLSSKLSLVAAGRTTGAALHVGDTVTHLVPIYEGNVYRKAVRSSRVGGRQATRFLQRFLTQCGLTYNGAAKLEIARDLKHKHGSFLAAPHVIGSSASSSKRRLTASAFALGDSDPVSPAPTYELPDGSRITLGDERTTCLEGLFRPGIYGGEATNPVGKVCASAIEKTPIGRIRNALWNNIVMDGATTLTPGFDRRALRGIRAYAHPSSKIEVPDSPTDEFSVWRGGAMLSQLHAYRAVFFDRHDYEEEGPNLVQKYWQ